MENQIIENEKMLDELYAKFIKKKEKRFFIKWIFGMAGGNK